MTPKDPGPPPIPKGSKGSKGDKGTQGVQGDIGETGETGSTGETGETGEQGHQGNQGNTGAEGKIGPRGRSGSNAEVISAIVGLGTQVETLDNNVTNERNARLLEKQSRDNQAKWFKRFFVASAVGILLAAGAGIGSWLNSQSIKQEAKDSSTRDQASLVGVCAITNVNRITNQNMLVDINVEKPFDLNENWPAFLAKWQAKWTPVECRALVSADLGVQLCLQYPPTNDPKTGKPVPTTIDPINKKACPESQPPPASTTPTVK